MPTQAEVLETLMPFVHAVADLDLCDSAAAMASLEAAFPIASLGAVHQQLAAARDEGWLTPRKATDALTFGRVAKPTEATRGLSIDAVDMAGAGAPHTHPSGEVSLCFAEGGDPRFCGHSEGWVVVPPGSHHTPDVTGGRMLIVYFLPDGAMIWD